jgi:hypothetical protein
VKGLSCHQHPPLRDAGLGFESPATKTCFGVAFSKARRALKTGRSAPTASPPRSRPAAPRRPGAPLVGPFRDRARAIPKMVFSSKQTHSVQPHSGGGGHLLSGTLNPSSAAVQGSTHSHRATCCPSPVCVSRSAHPTTPDPHCLRCACC